MEFVEASKKKQNHDKYLYAQAFLRQTYVRFVVVFFFFPTSTLFGLRMLHAHELCIAMVIRSSDF
jgi:hypothetical protein